MNVEVHVDRCGQARFVGRLRAHDHGPAVTFEYAPGWLQRIDAFAIDPTRMATAIMCSRRMGSVASRPRGGCRVLT